MKKTTKKCFFKTHNIKHIDYKNTELLKRFLTPDGRIVGRKRSGTSARYQRQLSLAIKRARYMGLLPYMVV